MDKKLYDAYKAAVENETRAYKVGYEFGLDRHFFGIEKVSNEEHEKFMEMDGRMKERGEGYRDGYVGKPPRDVHRGIGNKNRQIGEEKREKYMAVRVTDKMKKTYKDQAKRQGMDLSEWIIKTLDAACE